MNFHETAGTFYTEIEYDNFLFTISYDKKDGIVEIDGSNGNENGCVELDIVCPITTLESIALRAEFWFDACPTGYAQFYIEVDKRVFVEYKFYHHMSGRPIIKIGDSYTGVYMITDTDNLKEMLYEFRKKEMGI